MKNYVVYDDTGKISRTGSCHEDIVPLQARPNEFAMEVDVVITENSWVDVKTLQIIEKPKAIADQEKTVKDTFDALLAQERMIEDKGHEILRAMAIEELKKEGKLPK